MIEVTQKKLEEVMLKYFNKKTSYIGRLVNDNYKKIKPIRFAFIEWDDNGKMKSMVYIQELQLLKLI